VKVTFGRRALRDLGDYLIHVALSHGSEAPAIRERVRRVHIQRGHDIRPLAAVA
jgi:hypothetical protein